MAQNDPNGPPPAGLSGAIAEYMKRNAPTVSNHTVHLDGASYTGTRFENCVLVYSGGQLPFLVNNEYVNCTWNLAGPASNTLDFMRFLISIGGTDLVLRGLGLEGAGDGNR